MIRSLAIVLALAAASAARAGIYPTLPDVAFVGPNGTVQALPPVNFSLAYDDRINTMNPATPPERAANRIATLKRIADNKSKPRTAEGDLALSADLIRVGQAGEAFQILRGLDSTNDFRPTANAVQAHALSNDWASALEGQDYPKGVEAAANTPELQWRFGIEKKYVPIWLRYHRNMARNKTDPSTLKPIPFFPEGPLPPDAVAVVQQLALDAPTDVFLLWALAETTAKSGDFRTASALFDRCTNSGLTQPKALRDRRIEVQDLAAKMPKVQDVALLPMVEPPSPPPPPKGLFDLVDPKKFWLLAGSFTAIVVVLLGLQIRSIRRKRRRRV